MSVFLIVLPLESMAHGLFHELGNCLGGTCVGYAVVIPTNFCRYDIDKYFTDNIDVMKIVGTLLVPVCVLQNKC